MAVAIRVSVGKNRIYLRLDGFIPDEEAACAADKVIEEALKLKPGFAAVVDLSKFKPASPKAAEHVMRVQQAYKEHRVGRIIRIVGANVLGKMQMQRTASEVGGLDVQYANSAEEADRMLDSGKQARSRRADARPGRRRGAGLPYISYRALPPCQALGRLTGRASVRAAVQAVHRKTFCFRSLP